MDIREYNRKAWDKEVANGNRWTVPINSEQIKAAKRGEWQIYLTQEKPVPKNWFPPLKGIVVLCLASGGGQQGPILSAVGADVTVFDNSLAQLDRDREVANREGLSLKTIEGDMRDLKVFPGQLFDLIIHPVSNLFVPDIRPVWNETYRILKRGGILLSGFMNPAFYLFDFFEMESGKPLYVRYKIPYADVVNLPSEKLEILIANGSPLEFGHTLQDQIGGQTDAGFAITGFYEDYHIGLPIAEYIPTYGATRAVKY